MVIWKKSFGYSIKVYFSNNNIRQTLIILRARIILIGQPREKKVTNVKLKRAERTGKFNAKRKRNLDLSNVFGNPIIFIQSMTFDILPKPRKTMGKLTWLTKF